MSLLWARRGESVRCADSRGTRGKGSGRRRSCTQGLLAPHLPFVTPPPPQEHRQDAPTSGLLAQCPEQGHLGPGLSLACPPCQPPRLHLRRAFHLESPAPTACASHPEPPNPRIPVVLQARLAGRSGASKRGDRNRKAFLLAAACGAPGASTPACCVVPTTSPGGGRSA